MKKVLKNKLKLNSDEIILYTVRNKEEYNQLLKTKILKPDSKIIKQSWLDCPCFLNSYEWINNECKKRIIDYNQDYPLWAWQKRPNANSFKIEFVNDIFYIIKFKINKKKCLLSDFEKWHFVLNDLYLPKKLDENYLDCNFNISVFNKKGTKEEIKKQLDSWKNIFHLEGEENQACFSSLEMSQILEITEYQGKKVLD